MVPVAEILKHLNNNLETLKCDIIYPAILISYILCDDNREVGYHIICHVIGFVVLI